MADETTMRKADLAKEVAAKVDGMGIGAAEKAVGAVFDAITEALKEGNRVTLTGFGTFEVAKQEERDGRNPATGAAIKIAARKRVRFKLGSELDAIR